MLIYVSYINPEVNLTKAQMYDYHIECFTAKINSMMFPAKVT